MEALKSRIRDPNEGGFFEGVRREERESFGYRGREGGKEGGSAPSDPRWVPFSGVFPFQKVFWRNVFDGEAEGIIQPSASGYGLHLK